MHDEEAVQSAILSFVAEALGDRSLDATTELFESGLMNSLFAVELVTFVETAFDIVVDTDDLDIQNFNSVSNLTRFVTEKSPGLRCT